MPGTPDYLLDPDVVAEVKMGCDACCQPVVVNGMKIKNFPGSSSVGHNYNIC